MSQKLELNIDEVIVFRSDHGCDRIVLYLKNNDALKKALGKYSCVFDDTLQLEIPATKLHGEKLVKELGLVPDRIIKV